MSEKENMSKAARRNLLKSAVAGSGAMLVGKSLPDSWSRPVVDSVMLPAHAQTSGVFAGASRGITMLESNSLLASVSASLIQNAQAQPSSDQIDASYCFIVSDDKSSVDVDLILTIYNTQFDQNGPGPTCIENYFIPIANVPVDGGPVSLPKPSETGCNGRILSNNGSVKQSLSGNILASLGLVKNASAREELSEYSFEIAAVDGNVTGTLKFGRFIDNFTIGLGACEVYSPQCDNCDSIMLPN